MKYNTHLKRKYINQIWNDYYIDNEAVEDILERYNLSAKQFLDITNKIQKCNEFDIDELNRIRNIFYGINQDNAVVKFNSFNDFYCWYKFQFKKQIGACFYCGIEEEKLASYIKSKKDILPKLYNALHLVVARRNNTDEGYSRNNSVLMCHFCNTLKGDLFDEREYIEFLKDRKQFLNWDVER